MIAFGSGVIAMLFATKYGIAAPIVAVVLAAVIGLILGYLANNVLNMRIPVMIRSLVRDGHHRSACPYGLRCHDDRFL